MRKPDYKFYVDGVEVQPHYKSLKKKYAHESGQLFFRTTLEGQITLVGVDYLLVKDSSIEEQHTFAIMKRNTATGLYDYYFTSTFNKMDCTFDYDKRSCQLKLSAKDAYNDILNGYDNTYNLLEDAPAVSAIRLHKRPLIQVYKLGGNTISSFIGGEYWEHEVAEVVEDANKLMNYYKFALGAVASEMHISGAGHYPEANGTYAGLGSVMTNENGCTFRHRNPIPGVVDHYEIVRNSDGAVLYTSSEQYEYWESTEIHKNFRANPRFFSNDPAGSTEIVTADYVFTYPLYCRLLCDVGASTDGQATYALPIDDFVSDNRNYKYCIGFGIGNAANSFIASSKTTSAPTKYGVNDYGQYFTDQIVSAVTGVDRLFPVCRSTWANASIWFAYPPSYSLTDTKWRKAYILKDAYTITDVLKVLLAKLDPTVTHDASPEYSQFLYGDNPLGLAKLNLFITQKTNILKGEYDQAAQKAEISLEDVCNMLRDCFRCYWFIENGKFRIEHVSWFMGGRSYTGKPEVQFDLSDLYDQKNGKSLAYVSNKFKYNKSELSGRYEFAWMDDVSNAFLGHAIDVKAEYVQKDKTENIAVGNFVSDIDYMLLSPESFSNDGFALMAAVQAEDGVYELPIPTIRVDWGSWADGDEKVYSLTPQNGYLTWFYLQQYYMQDMPALGIAADKRIFGLHAYNVKKSMTQDITFPYEEDPDLYSLIATEYGNGQVESLAIDIDNRQIEAELVYTPA